MSDNATKSIFDWKPEKACEKIRANLLNCLLESECYKVVSEAVLNRWFEWHACKS